MKLLFASLAMLCMVICACGQRHEAATAPTSTNGISQFRVTDQDIQSVVIDDGASHQATNGPFIIVIKLNPNKSKEFHDFTANHLDQKVQIIVGTNIVTQPIIRAVLSGQDIVVSRRTLKEAKALVELLNQRPSNRK